MRRALVVAGYFVAGLLGTVLTLVGAHCWEDHRALHTLIQIETQRQQALQRPAPVAAPTSPK